MHDRPLSSARPISFTRIVVLAFLPFLGLGVAAPLADEIAIKAQEWRLSSHRVVSETYTTNDVGAGLSATIGETRLQRIRAVVPDAGARCLPIRERAADHTQNRLNELRGLLRRIETSTLGAWLIKQAQSRRVLVCLDGKTSLMGYFRAQIRVIGIRQDLSASARVVFLAHELAHVIQHPRYSNNRFFSPRDMALIQRHREAAAEALATCVLAQMKEAGDGAPWEAKKRTQYRDILSAYERELTSIRSGRPPGLQKGAELRAMQAAFRQWFMSSWRRDFYDGLIVDHLERVAMDDVGLLPTRRRATEHFLRGIASHNGRSFLTELDQDLTAPPFAVTFSADNKNRLQEILARTALRAQYGFHP